MGPGARPGRQWRLLTQLRDLAARFARGLPRNFTSSPKEGAGNAGCALHPRSRVQIVRRTRTRAYRFSGEHPASPAQWLYGLWRALLGDEFCPATVAAGFRLKRSSWSASATD